MSVKLCLHGPDTARYASNGKCVQCVKERSKRRHANTIKRAGNYRIGLAGGFVWFDTLYERLLKHIHITGPATHADLIADLPDAIGISVALGRLVTYGFLYRVGYTTNSSGVRGGYLFGLEPPREAPRVPSRYESQRRYMKSRPLRVPSVFEFRGSFRL